MNAGMNQAPLAERRNWPKLSETLPGSRSPDACWSCGARACDVPDDPEHGRVHLSWWLECDEWDKATTALVILCDECSKRIVGPHPRPYRHIVTSTMRPGGI